MTLDDEQELPGWLLIPLMAVVGIGFAAVYVTYPGPWYEGAGLALVLFAYCAYCWRNKILA